MRAVPVAFVVALACAGCGPTVDVTQAIKLDVVSTGWFDAGIVNGQNKLVPSITVTLKNTSDQKLPLLQVNSLFRQLDATEEWGSAFLTPNGSAGLGPGETRTLTLRSNNGYTGSEQTRQQMLENSHFVDAKVEVFAKYGSTQWKKMGDYAITRQLLEKS